MDIAQLICDFLPGSYSPSIISYTDTKCQLRSRSNGVTKRINKPAQYIEQCTIVLSVVKGGLCMRDYNAGETDYESRVCEVFVIVYKQNQT